MVSIIVPVYNAEKYLDQCLKSILSQSYQDFECILVDDGSTDQSSSMCDKWECYDSRIKVVHQENKGVSFARNRGIELSKGEYLTFIDSDDWIEKNYLQILLKNIETYSCDLVVCGLTQNFVDGSSCKIIPETKMVFSLREEHLSYFIRLNEKNLLYGPCLKLYRSSIVKKQHVLFDESCSYGEDLLFNYEYLKYIRQLVSVPYDLYHYRIFNENTLSNKFRINKFELDYKQWLVLNRFYKDMKLWNEESKRYLFKRLWGIIYDGVFLAYQIPCNQHKYISKVLQIPEIKYLRKYTSLFNCDSWIKYLILWRQSFLFYLIIKLRK